MRKWSVIMRSFARGYGLRLVSVWPPLFTACSSPAKSAASAAAAASAPKAAPATKAATAATAAVKAATLAVARPEPPSDNYYVVKDGDSLGAIAKRFGVSVATLTSLNDLADANQISIGQRLLLPAGHVDPRPRLPEPAWQAEEESRLRTKRRRSPMKMKPVPAALDQPGRAG